MTSRSFAGFLHSADGQIFKQKVRAALRRDVESLAEALFGAPKPSRSRRKELRFPGGIVVQLAGKWRGSWKCWTTLEGGTELKMIQFGRNRDETAAWEWSGHFTRIEPETRPWTETEKKAWLEKRRRERRDREEAARERAERERAARIRVALEIWSGCLRLAGTLGEKYLVAIRGIPVPAGGWPDCIRWHAGKRCVVFAATNDAGEMQAVHCIYLAANGRNVINPDGRKRKLTYGPRKRPLAVVRLPARDGFGLSDPLQRAEGCETGLSAWSATGYETWCLLGPLFQSDPPAGRRVVDLCDDHPAGDNIDRAYRATLAEWREAGINVNPAPPWEVRRGDKSDFNDVLVEAGVEAGLEAVRRRIRLAVLAAHGLKEAAPPFPLPTATPTELHTANRNAIRDFMSRRWDDEKPRVLLASATGSRKTGLLIDQVIPQVKVDRAKRRPHRVIYAVPGHRLGKQLARRIRRAIEEVGLTGQVAVAVYEGRGDPWNPPPSGREYLCQDLAPVGLALDAAADVNRAVCGKTRPGEPKCRFRAGCAYFRQLEECAAGDIVIMAHNFLFDGLREHQKALLDNVNAVVIEEDIGDDIGIGSVALPLSVFDSEQLERHPVLKRGPSGQARDNAKTEELDRIYAKIQDAIDLIEAGERPVPAVRAAGLSKAECDQARRLNWRRRIDDEMYPDMPRRERQERAAAASLNVTLPRIAAALHAFAQIADDATNRDNGDGPRLWVERGRLQVPGLREPAAWVDARPVIWASTTTRHERARQFFPTLEVVKPSAPVAPHQHVHLRLGAHGKSAFEKSAHKLDDMRDDIQVNMLGKKAGLVICYRAIEQAFAGIPNVKTLHHGSVAGDDDFRDIDALFVIGGPFARRRDIARIASAEARCWVPVAEPERTPCAALLADGGGVELTRLAYPDPRAQAVHAGIYGGAIEQAIGRARGINRTAADPVDVYVYANLPLSVPLASIERSWPPNRVAKMVLRGAVHANAADMHRFCPDLFPSPAAARQAMHRWGGAEAVRAEARRLFHKSSEPCLAVTWQPKGRGYHSRTDYVLRSRLEAFRTAVLREYPDGLEDWKLGVFTTGRPPPRGGEDCDTIGKEDSFPMVSHSSPPIEPPIPHAGAGAPRWEGSAPPDG
jgi:hypothetical protein